MRYLILTGKFGMGHISVAEAMKQELGSENQVYEADILYQLFPFASHAIYKSYAVMIGKCEKLYNAVYMRVEKKEGANAQIPLQRFFTKKVEEMLERYQPDRIISTLPFSSRVISSYKKATGSTIPLITCVTDVHTHPEWIYENTDLYFVPTQETKDEMVERGVPQESISITGLPIRRQFLNQNHQEGSYKKQVLIMGGGLGLIQEKSCVLKELSRMPDVEVTIITGKNKKAYNHLKNKYWNMKVIQYTNQVDQYMKKADLIVTKPGGITLFEAVHMTVPLFVVGPFMGQEVYNANYIEKRKIGTVIHQKQGSQEEKLRECLYNQRALSNMKTNMRAISKELSQNNITKAMKALEDQRGALCS